MKRQMFVGIDVGGTKVEGAIAELNLHERSINTLAKKRISTIHEVAGFVESLFSLINDLLAESALKLGDVLAVSLSLPGSLHPKTSLMLNGNTRFLVGEDVVGKLQKKLFSLDPNVRVFAQNDANLFALAEAWGGAGKHFENSYGVSFKDQVAVGVILGTGVGGGLISEGKMMRGAHGSSAEIGHIVLHAGGNRCYCGQQGCAETYLSGVAINKIMNSHEFFMKANQGAPEVLQTMIDYRLNLVQFMSIVNNLFNPHYFVFGGGLSTESILFEDLKTDLQENIFLGKEYCPEIYINHLGDSSGVFGAMIYASEKIRS